MRDPNGPIPGFEEEFTGSVGHEIRIHKTHFGVYSKPWRVTRKSAYEWVEFAPGRYRRVRRANDTATG